MTDGEWITLEEFVKSNPMVTEMLRLVERQMTCVRTRRTVEVTARKYRARRRRRK